VPESTASLSQLWRTLRELPRPVILLLVGVSINRMGSLVQIFLILYLTKIGITPARAGLVLTAYGFGSIVGVFVSGGVSDRIGPRQTILAGMCSSAALVALLPLIHAYLPLLVLCAGIGVATQLYRPAALAMLAALTPANRLVIISAAYRLGLNIGVTLAPLLGVALVTYSYTAVFLANAGTSLVFAVVAALTLPDARPERAGPQPPGEADRSRAGYRSLLRDRRFLIVIAAMLATALAEAQYQSVLPLQIHARGLPTVLYAGVLAINGAMVIAFELPSTVFVQRLRMRTSIAVGSCLIGFGIALFGIPAGFPIFIIGAVVWTTGEIISAPSISAYPALVAKPRLRGRYIGALSTSQSLGYAIGPSIGTALYELTGSGVWLMCVALGALAGLGMWTGVTSPRLPSADDRDAAPSLSSGADPVSD
jgi:MFS family permease